jgi:putative ABC transport system permease protein
VPLCLYGSKKASLKIEFMFKNYLKTAWRNLLRNKIYSFINVTGLTVGLTACLLVATVVLNDLSYDKQWKQAKNIHRVISINNNNKDAKERFPLCFTGLGPALKKDFPEVEDYCRMSVNKERLQLGHSIDGVNIKLLDAEPSVWNFLDFDIKEGTPKKFLKGYKNLIISEKLKKQYFPGSGAIGKIVKTVSSWGEPQQYVITGVIADIPSNTHLNADALLLHEFRATDDEMFKGEYGTFSPQYLLLNPATGVANFTSKVNAWYEKNVVGKKPGYSYNFQPITDVYLRSDFSKDENSGSIQNVYIFSGVAALLLFIACINFINLTTARALKRMRETGIRKVLGADRKQLIAQFLFESLLFFVIAFVLSLLLYNLFVPSVETFLGHPLTLNLTKNISLFVTASGFMLIVSLFTGLYPAWLLSHPQPVTVIKGMLADNIGTTLLRKSLVTGQFIISTVILIAAIIVQYQLHFLNHRDIGFDKNHLFKTDFSSWDNKGNAFKQEVMQLPSAEKVSIASWVPSLGGGSMSTQIEDPADNHNKLTAWYIQGDIDLTSTLKLQLLKGRWFNPDLPTDALNADSLMQKDMETFEALQKTQPVLITAYTAKLLDITALNKPVKGIEGIPVGIVKNFNNESLHLRIKPCIIRAAARTEYGYMMVRVKSGQEQAFLQQFNKLWRQFYPQKVLQFDWVNNLLEAQYRTEQKLQQLFIFFSCLTVLLACLGLFGLATFTAEQRTKEIGIRKVLGATVASITALLSKDFLKLVCLAILIASPIAGWLMNKWLQDYAYRINISWWMFTLAGFIAVFIALITISFQAIRAALANPVKSLRTE